jgi:hypothetical protein
MAKTKTFRVESGRTLFKCPICQSKRMYPIPAAVRQRSLRCDKCGEITRCTFNRRLEEREQQFGLALLQTGESADLAVELADISLRGVGFDIPQRDAGKVAVGRRISLKCPWNPHLFKNTRFIVRSIKGQRVGAEKEQ